MREHSGAEALAREMAMSVSQLHRKLNPAMGQPGGRMIRSISKPRQRAADWLARKAGSVAEL